MRRIGDHEGDRAGQQALDRTSGRAGQLGQCRERELEPEEHDRRRLVRPPSLEAIETVNAVLGVDRKSTRLNSSHANISYAVFCLKKKTHQSVVISISHDK